MKVVRDGMVMFSPTLLRPRVAGVFRSSSVKKEMEPLFWPSFASSSATTSCQSAMLAVQGSHVLNRCFGRSRSAPEGRVTSAPP